MTVGVIHERTHWKTKGLTKVTAAAVRDAHVFPPNHIRDGFLAGEVPNLVTEEGVPTIAEIQAITRDRFRKVAGTTMSAQDGTWRIDRLNPDARYDIIMRKDTYNDLIVANVTPIASPLIRNRTIRIVNGKLNLDVPLDFYGGEGAIVAAMVGGSLPFTVALHENHLVSGEVNAEVGDYTVALELTSGRYTVTQNITIEVRSTPLRISAVGLEDWYENEATITPVEVMVTGGRKPYTVTTDLPEGLSYSDGEISGTLGEDASDAWSDVIITVTDADGTVRRWRLWVLVGDDPYAVSGDPYWSNVVSLLRFDGDLTDEKGGSWSSQGTISFIGGVYGSAIKTTVNTYGAAYKAIGSFTENYTIEFYLCDWDVGLPGTYAYAVSGDARHIGPGSGIRMNFDTFLLESPAGSIAISGNITKGTPVHVALVDDGVESRLYLNGVLKTSSVSSTFVMSNGNLYVGCAASSSSSYNWMRGGVVIDELRITKGVARYTDDFDPPTEPFFNFGK